MSPEVDRSQLRDATQEVGQILHMREVEPDMTVLELGASRDELFLVADGLAEMWDMDVEVETLDALAKKWYEAGGSKDFRGMIADILSLRKDDE